MDEAKRVEISDFVRSSYAQGLTIVEVIKLVYMRFGLSLGESKVLVSEEPCWKGIVQAAEPLHRDIQNIFDKNDPL